MGIARAMVKLLMREGKKEPFHGKILTAGRQKVFITFSELISLAKEMDFVLNQKAKELYCLNHNVNSKNHISDDILFQLLGFNEIVSIDYSDFEGCTMVHDLNMDVPIEMHGCFDFVFDGGTSEHIFNFPKVLENYNKLLKVGGRVIHALPTSNFVDHGFYMFSPTVFYDYYSANKWEILDALLIKHSYRHDKRPWDVYRYTPGCLSRHSYGGLNNGLYGTFFVVKKLPDSSFDAAVQQGYYSHAWDKRAEKDRALKLFRSLPGGLREFLHWIITNYVPLRFFLKRIGRY